MFLIIPVHMYGVVNTKFLNCRKSNKLKKVSQIYFCINQIVSRISVSILSQKNTHLILSSLWSWPNRRSSWHWLEDGLNGLHNKSLALSLLEICCSARWFLDFRLKFFNALEAEFLQSFDFLKTWSWKWEGCPLFIVVLEDKLHFELICLKRCSRLWLAQIFLRNNYLYLSILINVIFL